MPPFILYAGQRFKREVIEEFTEATYGHTPSGWMDSDMFIAFLEDFNKYVTEQNIPKPVILFVDGHSTHMTLAAAQYCAKNNIILYCLLQNATHLLQACDIGLFSPMKQKWRQHVKEWQMEHLGEVFTKNNFPEVFKRTWESTTTLELSVHAFKRAGLFPLSLEGIDKSKLGPSMLAQHATGKVATTSDFGHSSVVTLTGKSAPVATVTVPRTTEVGNQADEQLVPSNPETSDTPETPDKDVALLPPLVSDQIVPKHSSVSTLHSDQRVPMSAPVATVTVTSTTEAGTQADEQFSGTPATPGKHQRSSSVAPPPMASEPLVTTSTSCVFRAVPMGGVRRDPSYVAAAFDHLRVPEIKPKSKQVTIRSKLPKALSGLEALKMLRQREEDKRVAEEQKILRKEERERKKREREEEKERKQRDRVNAKRVKMIERELKKARSVNGKGDCQESKKKVHYMDESDEEFDERQQCPGCLSCEGRECEWISCIGCKREWHVECCERDEFYGKTKEDLVNVEFLCDKCIE